MTDLLSIQQARDYLISLQLENKDNFIFRGENNDYLTITPCLYRQIDDLMKSISFMIPNICLHIIDNKLKQYITNNNEFTFLEEEPFGAKNLVDNSDSTFLNISYGIEALLQHYGLPTRWIDFTANVDTALYFANQDESTGIGYVYYCKIDQFSASDALIVNLSDFTMQLRKVLQFPKTRPESQNAYALRTIFENIRYSYKLESIKFRKEKEYIGKTHKEMFPPDALRTWLMGQIIDYFWDYKKRLKMYLEKENKSEAEVARYENLTKNFEKVISHLGLWE